jgi:membrane protease YdiL (CAAX protease family)
MTRPISSVGKGQAAIAAVASLALFGFIRLLFPTWSTGAPLLVLTRESVLLALVAAVLLFVVYGERIDPAALGFRRPRWSSVGWGLAGFLALLLTDVATTAIFSAFHIRQDTQTLAALAKQPLPVLLLIALTAALTEEVIFRSILVDHLGRLANSRWVGAVGSVLLFSAAHLSRWSGTQPFFVIPSGVILTALFLWKRDITACMLAHFLVDAVGLVAASANPA